VVIEKEKKFIGFSFQIRSVNGKVWRLFIIVVVCIIDISAMYIWYVQCNHWSITWRTRCAILQNVVSKQWSGLYTLEETSNSNEDE
jgi:hypothetical protein